MPETIASARCLAKTYRSGALEAREVDGIDLDIHAGEAVVLLGASGSGKSAPLNMLGGLDQATSGSLWFRGQRNVIKNFRKPRLK
jgi:putative ABC transport system ATP-binding protein